MWHCIVKVGSAWWLLGLWCLFGARTWATTVGSHLVQWLCMAMISFFCAFGESLNITKSSAWNNIDILTPPRCIPTPCRLCKIRFIPHTLQIDRMINIHLASAQLTFTSTCWTSAVYIVLQVFDTSGQRSLGLGRLRKSLKNTSFMMTSSNGNIFRVTGPLWGESTGDQWRGVLMFSLICTWTNGWANNQDAGDLRRHRAHYDDHQGNRVGY